MTFLKKIRRDLAQIFRHHMVWYIFFNGLFEYEGTQ